MLSVLPEKLKSFEYYVNKCPLYLQQSNGFLQHFRIWYDLAVSQIDNQGITNTIDKLLSSLNIFNEDYDYNTSSSILDIIGNIFGIKRFLSVEYYNEEELIKEEIELDNKDFLIFIKSQIIKNYCDGSLEQIKKFYESAGLNVVLKTNSPGQVDIYLLNIDNSDSSYSDNIKSLFLSEYLIIENLGIQFNPIVEEIGSVLIWDSENSQWDIGKWF